MYLECYLNMEIALTIRLNLLLKNMQIILQKSYFDIDMLGIVRLH